MPLKFKTEVTRQFIAPSDGTKFSTVEEAHWHEVYLLILQCYGHSPLSQLTEETKLNYERFCSSLLGDHQSKFAALLRVPTKRKAKVVKVKKARKKGDKSTMRNGDTIILCPHCSGPIDSMGGCNCSI